VEGALRSALEPQNTAAQLAAGGGTAQPKAAPTSAPTLLDSFSKPKAGGIKLKFLDEK
jgi:hypothetical protein